jgi:hypothetical protein
MHSNNINIGALIRYIGLSDNVVYGIVVKEHHTTHAVEVLWFDDEDNTKELVRDIRDGENSMDVINEN